jgi:hypothetical protein
MEQNDTVKKGSLIYATTEIERLKRQYNFDATEVMMLQVMKAIELEGVTYEDMLNKFIKVHQDKHVQQ